MNVINTPEPQAALEARHLLIHGRVQGVGFRHHMKQTAQRLGLAGWVRNLTQRTNDGHRTNDANDADDADDTVEALVIGPAEAVAALLAWARQGPPLAHVRRIDVEPVPLGELAEHIAAGDFQQRADA